MNKTIYIIYIIICLVIGLIISYIGVEYNNAGGIFMGGIILFCGIVLIIEFMNNVLDSNK